MDKIFTLFGGQESCNFVKCPLLTSFTAIDMIKVFVINC